MKSRDHQLVLDVEHLALVIGVLVELGVFALAVVADGFLFALPVFFGEAGQQAFGYQRVEGSLESR